MQWQLKDPTTRLPIYSWCQTVEPLAMEQALNLARHPVLESRIALMPDCHPGMGMPIGGVIAARDAVIPNAVGVDIGCGMVAVQTSLHAEALGEMPLRRSILNALHTVIPVGEGMGHPIEQDWEAFEAYRDAHLGRAGLWPTHRDRCNLGTLGGGNHFVEIQSAEDGSIWVMIHSGSRNLGHRIATHYHEAAKAFCEAKKIDLPHPDLAFLEASGETGQAYIDDMTFALTYAHENRRRMMQATKEVLTRFFPEVEFRREVNIHHNYAAQERHHDRLLWIHRKGATRAEKDEIGIIPGSMGTASYIVRGLGNPNSFESCSHGAGRKMSRIKANRELTLEACDEAMQGIVFKRWGIYRKAKMKCLDLSEAPGAYKDIEDVIAQEDDLVTPLVKLRPLLVMKG